jgi:predicted dehydrogenase/nucleoside-diphosphate-sugar epimerase
LTKDDDGMNRICLVGAGSIARAHAEAVAALPGLQLACVVDPNLAAAQRLARDFGDAPAYASIVEALAGVGFDRAHVLTPPDLHAAVAAELLEAGKPVLSEKPLAANSADCEALIAQANAANTPLGVNQNFVHHPAFARLRALVESGAYGRPRFVSCLYNVALRQLTARQFGHWMFRQPVNILLEQAVHPLSQIAALAGEIGEYAALPGPSVALCPGAELTTSLNLSLQGSRLPAQLRFAVGQEFPFWQISVICDDGALVADMLNNRLVRNGRTRWLEALDQALCGLSVAGDAAGAAVSNFVRYGLSTAKLTPRSDAFFLSMKDSIAAFHNALDQGAALELDGRFGARLVSLCEDIAQRCFTVPAPVAAQPRSDAPADIAILGGTGFIGCHLVAALVAQGKHVRVMARGIRNLQAIFDHPNVTLCRGTIGNEEDVASAIGEAKIVVNLAHGGGGADFAAIERAMVGGAETVAKVCQDRGVTRLVHVGSIASLYCGPQEGAITGATPPDPRETERGDYARAKALADRMLLEMHRGQNLPVVILRPGLVVGEGASPFHSGLGFYNTEQHCIGWNDGRNPLPFVLAQDVASSIIAAAWTPGIEGRCYNIIGDVQPSAREYFGWLKTALGRPLRYHPQVPRLLWCEDVGKFLVKRAAGRNAPMPPMRDFLSRGLMARFDCADAKRDLAWTPEADPRRFRQLAIEIHAR